MSDTPAKVLTDQCHQKMVAGDLPGAREDAVAAISLMDRPADFVRVWEYVTLLHEGWQLTQLLLEIEARILECIAKGVSGVDEDVIRALAARVRLALQDYDGFLAAFALIPDHIDNVWRARLAPVAAKLRAAEFPDLGAEKVFGIGLGHTGTHSLTEALMMLGYSASHYMNELTLGVLKLEDAYLFDALVDSPVCIFFETLAALFPNARFIYTTRDDASWVKSFTGHYDRRGRSSGLDHRKQTLVTRGAGVWGIARTSVHASLFWHHADPVAARQVYDDRVQRFFGANNPRLLTLDICGGDGWDKLCPFLGRPVPPAPFPWLNKAP